MFSLLFFFQVMFWFLSILSLSLSFLSINYDCFQSGRSTDKIDRLIAEAKQMVDNIIEWVRILLYA